MKGVDRPATAGAADDRALLRQRARELARPADESAAAGLELLEFRLAGERYAVAASAVDEVISLQQLTPLPGLPDFLTGIVNVRGRIVAALDLRGLLGLRASGLADVHDLVLVHGHGLELGLLADTVIGVHAIVPESLQAAPASDDGARNECVSGVTPDGLVVLDLDRLLADPRLVVDEGETS